MKRKLLLSTVAVLLAVSLAIVGCAQPAPAPAPAPTPAKPIVLKADVFWGPEYFANVNAQMPTLKAIEKESNGRITFDIYYAKALVPKDEAEECVAKGVADLAHVGFQYKAGAYPREAIQELPYALPMRSKNPQGDSKIMMGLLDKYYYKDVDPGVKVLSVYGVSLNRVMTSEKGGKVSSMEDLKGLKLRSAGGFNNEIVTLLGATPVAVLPGDLPEALAKGIVDGVFHSYASEWGWGGYKYLDYSTDLPINIFPLAWIINRAKFESMPSDLAQIVSRNLGEGGPLIAKSYWDAETEYFPQMGIEEMALSAQEKARWTAAVAPVWGTWIKAVEEKTDESAGEMIKTLASLWQKEGYTPPEMWAKLAK